MSGSKRFNMALIFIITLIALTTNLVSLPIAAASADQDQSSSPSFSNWYCLPKSEGYSAPQYCLPTTPRDQYREAKLADLIGEEAEMMVGLYIAPTADGVNLRQGPGMDNGVVGVVRAGEVLQVVDEPLADARTKIGTGEAWVRVRTASGVEAYTAGWLYEVVPPTAGSAAAETGDNAGTPLYLTPTVDEADVLAAPAGGNVLDWVARGEVVTAMEAAAVVRAKVGVPDQWLHVQTQAGVAGYTAAWHYTLADGSAKSETTVTAAPLYLTPVNDGINVRTTPENGSVVAVVGAGETVQAVDADATSKVGVYNAWVKVRTANGSEGYTAAWLYQITETAAPIPGTPVPGASESEAVGIEDIDGDSTTLYLTPKNDGINVRVAPVDGQVVAVVDQGEWVEVLEASDDAARKLTETASWVEIRTQDGIEGFTAAWLYEVAAVMEKPDTETDSGVIPPLVAGETTDAMVLDEGRSAITDLGVLGEDEPAALIPLNEGIMELDVPSTRYETTESEPVAEVGSVDAVAASEPVELTGELVNTMTPVTVDVENSADVTFAELAINGRSLATFNGEPFSYDLDTLWLSEGEYKLTFTTVNSSGIVQSDDLYFEVAFEADPAAVVKAAETDVTAVDITLGAESESALEVQPETAPQRVLLIEGEERPLALEFSTDDGLVPAPLAAGDEVLKTDETPKSLAAIIGKPVSSIVPAPLRGTLLEQHPTLAAVIILLMLALLVPQGLFTLYWMTYTWNNPRAAEAYRSPKEFTAPQYSFTALLPARHEDRVIKDTIHAVNAIDYPDELKEILILIRDEDDDATIHAAQEAIAEIGKDHIKLITFTEGPRNKPNGLNRGLKVATKDVVCVFDAEDEPHTDIYNIVNTVMKRDGADVVQSGVQLMNFRSTWFSAFNVLEYFFWFKSGLHAFTRKFHVTPLGGNTVFFKRHWLERINGWDEQCLTEDADVGIRLTQLGAQIQIVYDEKHATQEETPDTVESFIKQRTRWCQGFYEIFFKGDWRKLPTLKQRIVAIYILLNSLLQAANIFFIPAGLYIALTQQVALPIALLSYIPIYILLIQLVTNLIGIREFTSAYKVPLPRFFSLRMILFFYPYQLLLSVAAIRAVYRLLAQKRAWEKTAHSNLHRQGQLKTQVGA